MPTPASQLALNGQGPYDAQVVCDTVAGNGLLHLHP